MTMGIYNFKPQFVPYVEDGTKTHTIRAERKHPDSIGDWMHLYTGLRHKGARLLFRAPCVRVDFVRIEADYRVRIGSSVGFDSAPPLYGEGHLHGGFVELDGDERNALAWRDGFRPADGKRDGSFLVMMHFWAARLPFEGLIYHWDYTRRHPGLPAGTGQSGSKGSAPDKKAKRLIAL